METVLEEPQDLAAQLGGIADYREAPVGAVGAVGGGTLTAVLFAQRLLMCIC